MTTPVTHPYFDKFKKENPKAYKEWTPAAAPNVIQPKPSCPLKAPLSWWLEDFQKNHANLRRNSI